nr:putative polyhydroxyalkanoic acid system family protein [uncultured bacterium]
MADIHIHRKHKLGLAEARKIAWRWAEEVEHKFDMKCTVSEGETCDTVSFKRTGVSGELVVAKTHFELDAKLGFLLGAFSKTIESEIEKNLDDLLQASAENAKPAAASKPVKKPATKLAAAAKKTRRKAG